METRQLCTFWLDHLYLAVDVRHVQGVLSHQPLTRVPLAPPTVRGLMNLRGEIIAGVDLRPSLGLNDRNGDHLWINIILRAAAGPVSLLVDEIGQVAAVADDELEPPPETLAPMIREITEHVCQHDGRLMLLLDVEKVVRLGSGAAMEF